MLNSLSEGDGFHFANFTKSASDSICLSASYAPDLSDFMNLTLLSISSEVISILPILNIFSM